jgi:Xaa-Pro dipeptidase
MILGEQRAGMELSVLQQALCQEGIEAWLFCDFHRRDHVARTLLSLPKRGWMTRRWYYLVPAEGQPCRLLHHIEHDQLGHLPGELRTYRGWAELHQELRAMLAPYRSVAMNYSPLNEIPTVSMTDAGTVELVRSFGHDVVSSANLVQRCESRWSPEALETHLAAGRAVDQILQETFAEIGRRIQSEQPADEHQIQRFMSERFARYELTSDSLPIVAAGPHSGIPHYAPPHKGSARIQQGDFVLIDVWAKCDKPCAVYYDVTWTGYAGPQPPEQIEAVFHIVRRARDSAIKAVDDALRNERTIRGFEVDRAARGVIEAAGFGSHFVHRTGHSIGESVHANGANMDDLETHDERPVIPHTCFSIEPGIYLPEFGIRSEVDVYAEPRGARVTGAVQNEIVRIPTRP